jgi:hypothetical protein
MTPVRPPRAGLVRPEFGPTLPALLHERFGISERLAGVLLVGLLVGLAVLVALVARRDDGVAQLTHAAPPAFTLLYPERVMDVERPAAGELARLETSRGGVRAAVTVRPARLPPYPGTAIYGLAPVLAERRIDAVRRRSERFQLRGDGRTRVNGAPGYEIAYRTGPPGRRTYFREVVLVEDETARDGVLLTLRFATRGTLTDAGRDLIRLAKSAYRSFRFGTERP